MTLDRRIVRQVAEHLKCYVYMLVDPRTGVPFYVGKGRGTRMLAHGAQSASALARSVVDDATAERGAAADRGVPGRRPHASLGMTADELTAWALANGWQVMAGHPSLTKPSSPKEAIVRLVLKTTVVNLEVKKPAGKWEKVSGAAYADVREDPDTGLPGGLGFEKIPSFAMLMRENRDQKVFANMGGGPPKRR